MTICQRPELKLELYGVLLERRENGQAERQKLSLASYTPILVPIVDLRMDGGKAS